MGALSGNSNNVMYTARQMRVATNKTSKTENYEALNK